MPSVDQCDSSQAGVTTLSNTLEIFDKFKPAQDEEKDSDEESFHLPMLDDDESESKSTHSNSNGRIENGSQNGETEDDILNKFETVNCGSATPEQLDPKIEDIILEDQDETKINKDLLELKVECEESVLSDIKKDDILEIKKEENNTFEVVSKVQKVDVEIKLKDESEKYEESNNDKEFMSKYEYENLDNQSKSMERNDEVAMETESSDKIEENAPQIVSEVETDGQEQPNEDMEAEAEKLEKIDENKEGDAQLKDVKENDLDLKTQGEKSKETQKNNLDEDVIMEESNNESTVQEETTTKEHESLEYMNQDIEMEVLSLSEDKDKEKLDCTEGKIKEVEDSEVEKTKDSATEKVDNLNITSNTNMDDLLLVDDLEDKDETNDDEKELHVQVDSLIKDLDEELEDELQGKETEEIKEQDDKITKDNSEVAETETEDALLKELEETIKAPSEAKACEKPSEESALDSTADDSKTSTDVFMKPKEKEGPDKCESSNDSSKNPDNEDDLLDISIIRDAEEDDECARATAIADSSAMAEEQEKSDNDEQDEEQSEKTELENESEVDKDDNEPMDYDDGSNSECDNNIASVQTSDNDNENKDSDNVEKDVLEKDIEVFEKNSDEDVQIKDVNGDVEMIDSETEPKDDDVVKESEVMTDDKPVESPKVPSVEEKVDEVEDASSSSEVAVQTAENKENSSQPKTNKRALSDNDTEKEVSQNKKQKLQSSEKPVLSQAPLSQNDKVKTLTSFSQFMLSKKLKDKLTRSDLEQFCIQKICEVVMNKSNEGEMYQTIKKHEQTIEALRKDMQQLSKQAKDLEIVNKKLMNELRTLGSTKKPLVPLKITRSVGLQVRLNVGGDNQRKRPQQQQQQGQAGTVSTPPQQRQQQVNNTSSGGNTNRTRVVTLNKPQTVARQVLASPQKSPQTVNQNPLLSQALQNRRTPTAPNNVAKRTTPVRSKPNESSKPTNPGVIDLTDDLDDKAKGGTPVKILNKTVVTGTPGKTITLNKVVGPKSAVALQKGLANQAKTVTAKPATTTRTVAALPQGVRLTPSQVKNGGITIPAISSASGTTHMMYVLPTITSAGGPQKLALLNIQQSPNGILSGVLPNKQNITLKTVTNSPLRKHPAPLPGPPRPLNVDASLKPTLPKPQLTIRKTDNGIILQWKMPYNLDVYEAIASYQLYAYQETNAPPTTDMWRKVGDVKALALPMACTLTQFADKNKYYFAVRSVDVHKRIGAFSDPEEISL